MASLFIAHEHFSPAAHFGEEQAGQRFSVHLYKLTCARARRAELHSEGFFHYCGNPTRFFYFLRNI